MGHGLPPHFRMVRRPNEIKPRPPTFRRRHRCHLQGLPPKRAGRSAETQLSGEGSPSGLHHAPNSGVTTPPFTAESHTCQALLLSPTRSSTNLYDPSRDGGQEEREFEGHPLRVDASTYWKDREITADRCSWRIYQNDSPDQEVGTGNAAARASPLVDGSVDVSPGFPTSRSYR